MPAGARPAPARRYPDPHPPRAKRISLTPAGIAAAAAAESSRVRYIEDVFGILSAAECEEIVRVVGKLNERLAELGG